MSVARQALPLPGLVDVEAPQLDGLPARRRRRSACPARNCAKPAERALRIARRAACRAPDPGSPRAAARAATPIRGAGACLRACCPRRRSRRTCARRTPRAPRHRRPSRGGSRSVLTNYIGVHRFVSRSPRCARTRPAVSRRRRRRCRARDSEVRMPPSPPSMSTSRPATRPRCRRAGRRALRRTAVVLRDHVPVRRMRLDLAALDRPVLGAPEIEAVALADFDVGEHGAVGHRPPAHREIRRHELRQRSQRIILAAQDAHRGAELRARPQPEIAALDERGASRSRAARAPRPRARRAPCSISRCE